MKNDVDIGEMVGDYCPLHGDWSDDGEADLHRAQHASAEVAEPRGSCGPCFRLCHGEFNRRVAEMCDDLRCSIELAKQTQQFVPRA